MAAKKASLSKVLSELEKAGGQRLHLTLLKAFQEHGAKATCSEAEDFLARLRKTLAFGSDRKAAAAWAEECTKHPGWQQLRSRLFQQSQGGLSSLSNAQLSRAFNSLRHMDNLVNLEKETDKVWPIILQRIRGGNMRDARALLGVWTVAEDSRLTELDDSLAKALGAAEKLNTNQLLVGISRASDCPGSEAIKWCAGELSRRFADLSPEDLVAIVAHLGAREGRAVAEALQPLVRQALDELQTRSGNMETQHLVRLFPSIHSCRQQLWRKIRQQLINQKDLSATQIMEIFKLVHRLPDASVAETQLFDVAAKQLRKLLTEKADPALIITVARNLETMVHDRETCLALLNCALKLRKDLYPAAVWRIFMAASEWDLVGRHPDLRNRIRSLGNVMERHGTTGQKLTLSEMRDIAVAMRRNNVVLPKCVSQMTERFLEVLQTVRALPRGEAAVAGDAEAAEASEPREQVWGSISGDSDASGRDWLLEVQRLMLGFWAQLRLLGVDEPKLTEAVQELAANTQAWAVDAATLGEVLGELRGVEDPQVVELCGKIEGQLLAKLPSMGQMELLAVADAAASEQVREAVTAEVGRRLGGSRASASGVVASVSTLRRAEDFDSLVSFLVHHSAWSKGRGADIGASEGDEELVAKAEALLSISVPSIMEKEPAKASQRLLAALRALLAHGPRPDTAVGALAQALHLQAAQADAGLAQRPELQAAADLAFGFCVLYKGVLPFEVAARLWRLLGGAAARAAPRRGADAEAAVEALAGSGRAAELWAFGHSLRSSTSPSARAALRLMPEAATLDACLARLEAAPAKVDFNLFREGNAELCLERLRQHLPPESFAGHLPRASTPAAQA